MAGLLHQVCNSFDVGEICICEVGGCCAFATCASSATNSVDVGDEACGEVEVEDRVDSLKIDSSRHQVCANEYPNIAYSELLHDFVAFLLLFVSMDYVHVYLVEFQFVEQFLGSLL